MLNTRKQPSLLATISWVGLLVGTLDILSACIYFRINTGKNPEIVLQYIASAVFGKERAYSGDLSMKLLGLLFHYIVAYSFTTFFFLIYPRLPLLSKNRLLTGIFYGIFIWAVMRFIVVPQTRITRPKITPPFDWQKASIDAGILVLAIGIPLSYLAYRYYHYRRVNS